MNGRQRNAAIIAVILISMVLAAVLFMAYPAHKDDYSGIPSIDPYVNDDVGVLIDEDYYDLEDFCYEVELNNSCQIALLIVDDIGRYDLNTFALRTFEKNGIGQADKDNGVLVVFFVNDTSIRWRTVTGSGIMDILSGFVLKGFENDYLIPQMEQGDLSYGITLYVYAIGLELVDNYVSEGNDPGNDHPIWFIPLSGWQLTLVAIGIVALVVITRGRAILWIFFLFSRGGGGGRFGGGGTGGGGSRGRY